MNLRSLSVVVFLFVVFPAFAQNHIFSDGFESGDTCAWQGCLSAALLATDADQVDGHGAVYLVDFMLSASGQDAFIEKAWGRGVPNSTNGFWFTVEGDSGIYAGGSIPAVHMTGFGDGIALGDTPSHFRIPNGVSRRFWLMVGFDNLGGVAGFYRMRLAGVTSDQDGADSDGGNVSLFPSSYRTEPVFVGTTDD